MSLLGYHWKRKQFHAALYIWCALLHSSAAHFFQVLYIPPAFKTKYHAKKIFEMKHELRVLCTILTFTRISKLWHYESMGLLIVCAKVLMTYNSNKTLGFDVHVLKSGRPSLGKTAMIAIPTYMSIIMYI